MSATQGRREGRWHPPSQCGQLGGVQRPNGRQPVESSARRRATKADRRPTHFTNSWDQGGTSNTPASTVARRVRNAPARTRGPLSPVESSVRNWEQPGRGRARPAATFPGRNNVNVGSGTGEQEYHWWRQYVQQRQQHQGRRRKHHERQCWNVIRERECSATVSITPNNSQAWVSQRQNWGNNVRTGVGGRYNPFSTKLLPSRRHSRGWLQLLPRLGGARPLLRLEPRDLGRLRVVPRSAAGQRQPVYYATVRAATSFTKTTSSTLTARPPARPSSTTQQAQSHAAAAPAADQTNAQEQEWLPLGVFALTSEDTGDTQAVVQLAVNKQGVIAGTYYNEANQASRPDPGTDRSVKPSESQ